MDLADTLRGLEDQQGALLDALSELADEERAPSAELVARLEEFMAEVGNALDKASGQLEESEEYDTGYRTLVQLLLDVERGLATWTDVERYLRHETWGVGE